MGHNIVGVQFRKTGKIYDFDGRDFTLAVGDFVVVDTDRGQSIAEVKKIQFQQLGEKERLKSIVRLASDRDLKASDRLTEERVETFSNQKIKELKLKMKVISAEVQFGGQKAIIFFSAPGRVDFRELVKELATGLKTRVELKQIGARDEAKHTGGIGICGREYCCSSFLREFIPVSIKMAKNQNLALNPSKISGGCGRLLCCLTYEDKTYKALRKKLLPKRTRVQLPDGSQGDVIKGDILNQTVLVEDENGQQAKYKLDEVTVIDKATVNQEASEAEQWADDLDLDALMDDSGAKATTAKDEARGAQRPDRPRRGRSGRGRDSRSDSPQSAKDGHGRASGRGGSRRSGKPRSGNPRPQENRHKGADRGGQTKRGPRNDGKPGDSRGDN